MNEHPIIFSQPMIPPIMDDIKTETRRVNGLEKININPDDWQFEWGDFALDKPWRFTQKSTVNEKSLASKTFHQEALKCRYGKPGEFLWVRETWKENTIPMGWPYHYLAANETFTHPEYEKWKPSIHMPRKAARIFLDIKSIRVERLQQITEEGSIEEGVEYNGTFYRDYLDKFSACYTKHSAKESYQSLWTKLNGPGSWELNPWVWVIKFKFLKDYDARN